MARSLPYDAMSYSAAPPGTPSQMKTASEFELWFSMRAQEIQQKYARATAAALSEQALTWTSSVCRVSRAAAGTT